MNNNFKKFIHKILLFANNKYNTNITDDDINNKYFTVSNFEQFQISFTHKSISQNNYEYYEFIGDKVLNDCVVNYIHTRFPQIINSDILTKLLHKHKGKTFLSQVGTKYGFNEFIIYDKKTVDISSKTLTEDIIESFIGCVYTLSTKIFDMIKAYDIVYNIITNLFNGMENSYFVINYNALVDDYTKLKELYPQMRPEGLVEWDIGHNIVYKVEDGKRKIEIYGYPKGEKILLSSTTYSVPPSADASKVEEIKNEAKLKAASFALKFLKNNFGIVPKNKSPYVADIKPPKQKKEEIIEHSSSNDKEDNNDENSDEE